MRTLLLCLLTLLCIRGRAQAPANQPATDCDCAANFAWVKKTFSENDAGFQYAIDRKGQQAYEDLTNKIEAVTDTLSDFGRCQGAMYEWLSWFRPGHIAIRQLEQGQDNGQTAAAPESDEEIRERFADWKSIEMPLDAFEASLREADDYEGVWRTGPYRIGIKKMEDRYIGAILSADGIWWSPGQIKLEFTPDSLLTFYMRDHSTRIVDAPMLVGRNRLEVDFVSLIRETERPENDPLLKLYLRAEASPVPLYERIDDRTVYLRIPSFRHENKAIVDSTIAAHLDDILATPNLILDIHSGTGGSDEVFAELLPILYTNPIRTTNVEYLSTPLNNQRMLDFANDAQGWNFDEEMKEWARKSYELLQAKPGAFVNVNEGQAREDTTTFDTVYPYPSNVAIIIDGGNGSTDEEFLLAAKQSRKVKLYGQSTFGVLDISNMIFFPSPCEEFELGYSISRSLRIPHFTIDGVGIQPDFFIDGQVPKWKWLPYVLDLLRSGGQ